MEIVDSFLNLAKGVGFLNLAKGVGILIKNLALTDSYGTVYTNHSNISKLAVDYF